MASDPYTLTILKVPADLRHEKILTKTYTPGAGGKLERTEYDAGMYFAVSQKRCATIQEWAAFQAQLAAVPFACLIRGEPDGINPQRARRLQTNFPDVPRCPILFDFDTVKLPRGLPGVEAARLKLPPQFHNAPCWWQRTGSYGVDFIGRDEDDDPWASRLRLGFMLDKPLTTPQIKFWLREHRKIVDLAIYTSNQINYTANPVFRDGAIDPVLAAGEKRFGTLDLDDALVDEVIVPDEIANYIPSYDGVAVASRPPTISASKLKTLMDEADECDAEKGNRHGTVACWVFDAFALGMAEQAIIDTAQRTLERLGRDAKQAAPEAERLLMGAKRKMADDTLTVSRHLTANSDFTAVALDDPALNPPALTPAQAAVQSRQLIQWWTRLKVTASTGAFKASMSNASIVVNNHSSFLDKDGVNILAYDAFRDVPVWTAPPPWWRSRPKGTLPEIGELGCPLTDDDGTALAIWLGSLDPASGPEATPFDINKNVAIDALVHVARYRTVNPVREYLDQCAAAWDGVPRLDKVLTEVCHAKPENIVKSWFRKWMMQSVARVHRPGAKCDGVLIFQGKQGHKKSTFFRTLCPFEQLFFEGTIDFRDKDSMQNIQGKLIVELAEMSGTRKDVDVIKAYMTKQDDTYRASFGRISERRPRRTIFCGTTNDEDSLSDPGRRWWVAELQDHSAIDLERTKREVKQWWGEAVVAFRKGEEWWLDTDEDDKTRSIAETHGIGLEMAEYIREWLDRPSDQGGAPNRDVVRPVEIWCGPLGKMHSAWSSGSGREVARVMSALKGWKRELVKITPLHGFRAYIRIGSKMDLDRRHLKDYLAHHSATSSDFASDPAA